MDKRKSLLNVTVSVASKIITMIVVIIVRRLLIQTCGNEVNGLNALYINIVGFLSVAELGVGSAITFCMYKPIVEGNQDQVSALYHLFRRVYAVIGIIILASGLAITPFIHYFAKDYASLDVNLYITFLLMLFSVVVAYFFGAKTALMNAYKNNYITNVISSGILLLQYLLQILALLITGSFIWYLICRIIAELVKWLVTNIFIHKKYQAVVTNYQKVNQETQKTLIRSIKAMFMHKVGAKLVNSADSIIISMFVGVIALGEYSNYTTILSSLTAVLKLVFTSLTSVFGHLYAEKSKDITKKYSESFHILNFMIGVLFHLGYYAIIDNLIAILFSPELIVSKSISFVIAMNGFVQFMRQNTLTFRDATGAFYNDRWKPLFEGALNVILSILFVKKIGVTGVIAATIATNLMLCHVIEPYVLYKYSFSCSPKIFYIKNYGMIAIFTAMLLLLDRIMISHQSQWIELLANGFISVGLSAIACLIVILLDRETCRFALRAIRER